ncbi:MAG: glycosyltransferase [Rubellimicrobium sp.]|nr:glycosyltransferase [Rubellimicrobium sp.]
MTQATASVVIVSRWRPEALSLCLAGVGQLLHPAFEIVVVADGESIASLPGGLRARIKTRSFDGANISAARNLGIGLAAGEVVAFIDDDAVPEPGWLARLARPLADPGVAGAGGFVRGRNGISFQWTGRLVDGHARHHPLPDAPAIIAQRAGLALKTEGTCMAFRREALIALGGFDPALRFYLDETDLNLRLAATGARAALVPLAQVHHAFAPSERRRADRVAVSLHDVGRSLALFLRRHAGGADPARLAEEVAERQAGLAAHRRAGRIDRAEGARLIATLHEGWEEGVAAPLGPLPLLPLRTDPPPFLRWQGAGDAGNAGGHRILSGRPRDRDRLTQEAIAAARRGEIASVFLFSTGVARHRIAFQPGGFWLQTGGLCGASLRSDPAFRPWRRRRRVARECALVASLRQYDPKSDG